MDDGRMWLRLQCDKLTRYLLADSHRKANDKKKRLYTYNSKDLFHPGRRNPHFEHEREIISDSLRSSNSNLDQSGFRNPLFGSNNRIGLNSSRNGYGSMYRDAFSLGTSVNRSVQMAESDLLSPFRPISLSTPKKQDLSNLKSILKKTPESQTLSSDMTEKENTKSICYDRSKHKETYHSSIFGKSYKRTVHHMNDGNSSPEESFPSGLSYSKRRAKKFSVNSGIDSIESIDSKVPEARDIVSAAINLRLPTYSQSSSHNHCSREALSVSHNRHLTIIPRVVLPTASRRPRVSLFKNKSKSKEIVAAVLENIKKPFSIDGEKIDAVSPKDSVAATDIKTSSIPSETFTVTLQPGSSTEIPKSSDEFTENQPTSKITLIPQINIQSVSSGIVDRPEVVVSAVESTTPVTSTPTLPLIIPPSSSFPLTLPTISISSSTSSFPSYSSEGTVDSAISNQIPKFEFKNPSTENSSPSVSTSISIPPVSSFGPSATTTIAVTSTTECDVEINNGQVKSTQGSINSLFDLSQAPVSETESKPFSFPVISRPSLFPSTSSTVSSGIVSIPNLFPKISIPDISTQATSITSVSIPSTSTSSLFSVAPKEPPIFVSSNVESNKIDIPKNICLFSTPSTTTTNTFDIKPLCSLSEIAAPLTTTSSTDTNSKPSFTLPKFNFSSMPITTSSFSSTTSIFPTSSTTIPNSSPFPTVQPIPSLSAIFAPKDQSSLSLPSTLATSTISVPSSSSIFVGGNADSCSAKVPLPSGGLFGLSTVTTNTSTNNPISSILPSASSEPPKFSFNLPSASNQFSSTNLPSGSKFSFSNNPIQPTKPSSNSTSGEGGFKFEFKPPENSSKPFNFMEKSGSSSLTPFVFNLNPSTSTTLFGAGSTPNTTLFSNQSTGGSGFSFGNLSTQPSGSSVPSSFTLNSSTPYSSNPIGGQTNQNIGNSTSSNQRILIRPRRRH